MWCPIMDPNSQVLSLHSLLRIGTSDKIVIPSSLQKEMKERIHQGHLGIEKCRARAGQIMYWPDINADISDVVSNNGPQFSSFEFAQFAKDWDFIHDSSSPKYPKSDGMAENAVKIVKGLLKKADKHKKDPYLASIAHRSTPSSSNNKSPYEKLFGHAMRATLPDLHNMRKSKNIPASDLPAKFQPKYSNKQRHYYNRSAKELPDIPVGSTVRIHKDNSWPTKAKVVAKAQLP